MSIDLDALTRFPIFSEFDGPDLTAVASMLSEIELMPGEVLFDEGAAGNSFFCLHLGRIEIEREAAAGKYESLATIDAPSILGEMAVVRQAPRSARAVAMRPSVLWEMQASDLDRLAATDSTAAYKLMRWFARKVGDRLDATNNKLIEIYAKPYKSIVELKARLKELQPGMVSVGLEDVDLE